VSALDYGTENSQLWAKKMELDKRIFTLERHRRWLGVGLALTLAVLAAFVLNAARG
jgi:hypothetical protein